MRIFCRVLIEAFEVESTEAPIKTLRKTEGVIVLTIDMNGLEDSGNEDGAEPE